MHITWKLIWNCAYRKGNTNEKNINRNISNSCILANIRNCCCNSIVIIRINIWILIQFKFFSNQVFYEYFRNYFVHIYSNNNSFYFFIYYFIYFLFIFYCLFFKLFLFFIRLTISLLSVALAASLSSSFILLMFSLISSSS